MKKLSLRSSQGFSAIEAIIIIVIVAAIVAIGYVVFNRVNDNKEQTTSQTTGTDTPAAPDINNSSDLDEADTTLDSTDVDAATSDSSELDTELSEF